MLNKTGAGAQHPIRSHWMLRPSPQSYKNSKQQRKCYRANTITANSKPSATKKQHSNRSSLPRSPPCRIHLPHFPGVRILWASAGRVSLDPSHTPPPSLPLASASWTMRGYAQ